jgi:hypothetical protein
MESAHLICLECPRSTGGPRRGSSWLDPATRRLRALPVGRDQKFYRRGFGRGFPVPDRSGFGEGTALGLPQKGHSVIAAIQTWPQVTAMREKAHSLDLKTLRVEKLDLLDLYDVAHTLKIKFDILVHNAASAREGPCRKSPLSWCGRILKQMSLRLWILHSAW